MPLPVCQPAHLSLHLGHACPRRGGERQAGCDVHRPRQFQTHQRTSATFSDLLLCRVARRIRSAVRANRFIVARISGDRFVMVIGRGQLPGDAATVAQKDYRKVSQPLRLRCRKRTSPSIGICVFRRTVGDIDTDENADTAMYHARGLGRNNYQFYAAEIRLRRRSSACNSNRAGPPWQGAPICPCYRPQVDVRPDAPMASKRSSAGSRWVAAGAAGDSSPWRKRSD